MKFRPNILALAAALLLVVALAGCSSEDTPVSAAATGGDDYTQIDFAQTYGGLTTSDEAVAFGDEALLTMSLAEDGEEFADPVADDPAVRDMAMAGTRPQDPNDRQRPHFTFVHLRWGMLRDMMDSVAIEPPCDVTDWTGAITVDRGVLVVRRVIRFERPLDHIILPRLDFQTVGLVSHTACGLDGLVLEIMERPAAIGDPDSTGLEPNVLHINLGDFSADFAVADLAGTDAVYDVGISGAKIAVTGFTMSDVEVCPKGFLSGHFRALPTDLPDSVRNGDRPGEQYGVFAGMWRNPAGRIDGHLRGGYGVDENGERIFIGKYIGPRGHFRGLIRGTWEPGVAPAVPAVFSGHWANAAGTVDGRLGGECFPVEGTPGGFFTGRWSALCDDDAVQGI